MSILIRCAFLALMLICAAAGIAAAVSAAAWIGWFAGASAAGIGFLFAHDYAVRRSELAEREERLGLILGALEQTESDLLAANELCARSARAMGEIRAALFAA